MASSPGVVLASGHLVDVPGRPYPRFPPDQVPRVATEMRAAFEGWGVGPATTLITGGARGADILAAEQAMARRARVRLCLALPPAEFRPLCVHLPGTDWSARFDALLAAADIEVVERRAGVRSPFEAANARMIAIAREIDPTAPRVVIVWDGRRGDGPGGTRDFVARLHGPHAPAELIVIDPILPA